MGAFPNVLMDVESLAGLAEGTEHEEQVAHSRGAVTIEVRRAGARSGDLAGTVVVAVAVVVATTTNTTILVATILLPLEPIVVPVLISN